MKILQSKYFGYIVFLLFALFMLWSFGPMKTIEKKLVNVTGSKEMLDLKPALSSNEVYSYVNKIGPAGCDVLKEMYTFQDLIYPLIYGLFFACGLVFFISRSFPQKKKLFWFSLPAFLMVIADYLENFSLLKIVSNPDKQLAIANYVGTFTTVKWGLGLLTMIFFLIFFLIFVIKKVIKKKAA